MRLRHYSIRTEPAERWGDAVFKIGDEKILFEVSVEQDVINAMMAGDDAAWKVHLRASRSF
ncbi:MAG: hypothetical protein KAV87_35915 [Desulfobacteraceae bacterium]|nr:hypothetical protein [Desulfobacteraceae bacterium]